MAAEISNNQENSGGSHRKNSITLCGFAIIFFVFINDLVGWIEGGGIFSVFHAVHDVRDNVKIVDVDEAGLRSLFLLGTALVVTAICVMRNVDVSRRGWMYIFWLSVIGGGYVLDGICDQRIVQSFMANHGYIRCPAHDFERGNGKGRVWLNDYVRTYEDCLRD